jgi:hypothetical protein
MTRGPCGDAGVGAKVFCFFFSKKEDLTCFVAAVSRELGLKTRLAGLKWD